MSNVFGYTRVSTAKQGVQGVSLQEQRAAIERYAIASGLTIVAWFEEKQTAAKQGRPVFSQLLRKLRHGDATGVVIHKIDRSARNLKDWSDLGELIDSGIAVHFANERLDMHSRGGRLSADIQAVIAADYIRNLREEARKGFYGRLKQGVYPLPAPIGYQDNGAGKPKSPDPVTAPLIRLAFELYATGSFSIEQLRNKLHEMGLRNSYGNAISKSHISSCLRNPFYTGIMRIRRTGEIFEGKHESIVNRAVFNRVQNVLDGRHTRKSSKHDFIFQRLFRCSKCRRYLVGEKQKGHIYYRCHTHKCPTSLREESLHAAFMQAISGIHLNEEEFECLTDRLASYHESSQKTHEKRLATLKMEQEKLLSREHRLTDAYIDNLIERHTYLDRKKALLEEKITINEQIANLTGEIDTAHKGISKFFEQVKTLQNNYEMGLPYEKREIIKNVSSNRYVSGKDIDIELYSPYAEFKKYMIREDGGPCRDICRTFDVNNLIDSLNNYYSVLYRQDLHES